MVLHKEVGDRCLVDTAPGYAPKSAGGATGFKIKVGDPANPVKETLNQLYSPDMYFNAKARQMWYFRAEEPGEKEGDPPLWTADFYPDGVNGSDDYSKAPWNLFIIMGFVPTTPPPPTPGVGEHKLYSKEEFIEAELSETVTANQHIDWTQSETAVNGIVSALQVGYSKIDFSTPRPMTLVLKDISYDVTKSGAPDIGYEYKPSNKQYPLNKQIPLTDTTGVRRPWTAVEADIKSAIASFTKKWGGYQLQQVALTHQVLICGSMILLQN